MNEDTRSLFDRVAEKMGWKGQGGLDRAENELMNSIGKTRRGAVSGHRLAANPSPNLCLSLSKSDNDAEKENLISNGNSYRNQPLVDSGDDEFDQFLVARATPRAKPATQKPCSAKKKENSAFVVVSSDDDCNFETFLQRVKTPNTKPRKPSECSSEDSLKNFIVDDLSTDDDFEEPKLSLKVHKKGTTPAAKPRARKPMSHIDTPVFLSDSDDEDNAILVKSTWKSRHSKPKAAAKSKSNNVPLSDKDDDSPSLPSLSVPPPFSFQPQRLPSSPKRTFSLPSRLGDSTSSDEEFTSLLDRLKKKNNPISSTMSPKVTKAETPQQVKTPVNPTILKPMVSQTEPRRNPVSRLTMCKTPGCFLESLSQPASSYGQKFKDNKEDLTARLYQLYNTTVFDNKLPANMSVTWNKKMRKTAGYCVTGQERGGGRYARIELSVKVCDSADRLRDTLIHEMCHAATWIINSVRDGHGNFWKLYARKSTLVHPELPMVTRCHSYDIKYKFQYQCNRCQNIIGRHSKSLDTEKFVCALCKGHFVLLTPTQPRAPTPFANFVKENYGTVRQELVGQSHGEVMRKLSADFASKTKLGQK